MKLYHSASSPNSRRVRIFLAEKGLSIPLVTVDLGKADNIPTPTEPSTRAASCLR
jgi:glutathione S-transferase